MRWRCPFPSAPGVSSHTQLERERERRRERERDWGFIPGRHCCSSTWQELHPFQSDETRLLRQMLSKSWTCEVLLWVQEITGYKSARIISAHTDSLLGHSGSGYIVFFLCNDFWCCGFGWIRPFRGKRGILIYKIVKCQIKSLNNVCV